MGAIEKYKSRNEARDARKAEKQKPRPKRLWWFQQPQPIDRFTGWLVAWTALLFIGTIISAAILFKTDNTLQETLTATQRPWVSIAAEFSGPIVRKQSKYLTADIRNLVEKFWSYARY